MKCHDVHGATGKRKGAEGSIQSSNFCLNMVLLTYTHMSLANASDMDKPNINGSEKCGPLTGRAGEDSRGNTPPVGVDYALSIPRYSLISNVIFSVLKTDPVKGILYTL